MYRKIHPPRPSRFPLCGDFAPLGPRDCPRASPSGNLSGLGVQNPRPWEISWASGGVFSDTSLLSAVYGFIIIIMWRGLAIPDLCLSSAETLWAAPAMDVISIVIVVIVVVFVTFISSHH